ncbi:hypothetical protein SAMN05421786_11541 [Chryseobacterium ureilyticum]|uniref:Phage tail tube protein n=1 Tax=Chryseobacterium ureilyticum TaxID=373668 RepID=A0A1N7QRW8_9FLAO|nr:hypothetical protein [Chryseobacterium ureilyticum]SIT25623.1 hypothetical protein SAMN05421786_11541 [Chryseobacterium ureilyticum]
MNVNITSSECAWANFEVQILNRRIKGLRGFESKKSVEADPLYGSGMEPIDITKGNIKYEGNIKVLGFEADAMNKAAQDAGYDDITEVPHELIIISISFKRRLTDKLKSIITTGVQFTEDGISMEQGAKNREVTLPFIAMGRQQIH